MPTSDAVEDARQRSAATALVAVLATEARITDAAGGAGVIIIGLTATSTTLDRITYVKLIALVTPPALVALALRRSPCSRTLPVGTAVERTLHVAVLSAVACITLALAGLQVTLTVTAAVDVLALLELQRECIVTR